MQRTKENRTEQDSVEGSKFNSVDSDESRYSGFDDFSESFSMDSWDNLEKRFGRTAKRRLMSGELLKTLVPSFVFSFVFMFFLFGSMSFVNAALVSPLASFVAFFVTGILVDGDDFDSIVSGLVTGVFTSVPLAFVLGVLPLRFLSILLGGFQDTLVSYGFLWFDLSMMVGFAGCLLAVLTGVMSVFSMRIGGRVRGLIDNCI